MPRGFEQAREHGWIVVAERYFSGADHRILVINGQVVAVAKRIPAHAVGDGIRTIAELIEDVNSDPRRGEGHSSFLTRISVDDCVHRFPESGGMTVDTIEDMAAVKSVVWNLCGGAVGASSTPTTNKL